MRSAARPARGGRGRPRTAARCADPSGPSDQPPGVAPPTVAAGVLAAVVAAGGGVAVVPVEAAGVGAVAPVVAGVWVVVGVCVVVTGAPVLGTLEIVCGSSVVVVGVTVAGAPARPSAPVESVGTVGSNAVEASPCDGMDAATDPPMRLPPDPR